MKPRGKKATDDTRPEYDLGTLLEGGVKGKYANQFRKGTNPVLIEPEIHDEFRTEKEVNDALRLVIELRRIGGPRRSALR